MANEGLCTMHPHVDNPVDDQPRNAEVIHWPPGQYAVIHTISAEYASYPRLYPRDYARPNRLARIKRYAALDKYLCIRYYFVVQDF